MIGIIGFALAAAAPHDFTAMTRGAQAAIDSSDAAQLQALFCPGAVVVRPDGLVSSAARMLETLRGGASGSTLKRSWKSIDVRRVGDVVVAVGQTTAEARWGKAESLTTMVWQGAARGSPCLSLVQRAPGGTAAAAAHWDAVFLTSETINREPNALLVEAINGVKPGRALDVGMGQGRNALFLAKQGWTVTGFDVAGEGLRLARAQAAIANVSIETVYASDADFDFGRDRWDLIAFIYSPVRGLPEKSFVGLRPGGLVVAEAFHADGDPARAGTGVYYRAGEMRALFERAGFEIVRYDEPVDVADYGRQRVKLVRLIARKPAR